ncbi:MAG: hypothetical protein HY938_09050 [Nitrosomonadales bacterium]|nr:hypothetical protein [Nitrosomonadales bacterium]
MLDDESGYRAGQLMSGSISPVRGAYFSSGRTILRTGQGARCVWKMHRAVFSGLCNISLPVISLLAYCSIAFGADASHTANLPKASSLQIAALGAEVNGIEPVGVADILYLEPVCALIFKHSNLLQKNHSLQQWYLQLKGSPLLDMPENNIAKGVSSFHHYCWSKVAENRYYRETNRMKKAGLSKYAANNYKFVIDHSEYRPVDWPYLPKLYVDYGNALMLGGKLSQSPLAIDAFETALRYNKGFVPAMMALADVYGKLGEKNKALEYVTEGLRYKPNSNGLKVRYEELGGKPPYPEPYPSDQPASHAEETGKTTPPEGMGAEGGMIPHATMAPSAKDAGQGADTKSAEPDARSMGKDQNQTATGAGKPPVGNPYCRFCP